MQAVAEPLEIIAACHAPIEERLQALENLAFDSATCTPAAAAVVLRYFDSAGAQHQRDEDEDLFPLLRARAAALGRIEVAAAIDEIQREHATLESQWRRLREALGAIAERREGRIDAQDVTRFAWLYRRHMDRESQLLLPFAREALAAGERAELAARMAARRA